VNFCQPPRETHFQIGHGFLSCAIATKFKLAGRAVPKDRCNITFSLVTHVASILVGTFVGFYFLCVVSALKQAVMHGAW